MKLEEAICRGIADGDLLFFSGRSFFGRLIRWWTQSVYSHVAIALWVRVDRFPRLCAFESLEGYGVRLTPLDVYLHERSQNGELVDWFKVSDRTICRATVVKSLLETWGRRYSSPWQFVWSFGLLSRRVRRWLGLRAPIDESKAFCSWEAARAFMQAGFVPDQALPIEPAEMSPGDVARFTCLQRMGSLEGN